MNSDTVTFHWYRNYLLTSLIVLYAFNYVDSMALGIALQSIKADLFLTDSQLGLLSGLAFWLFYAAFGVPMGQWADRGNRITVLFVTRLLWALFVVLTGAATSFLQLFVLRAGAGVGESGFLPAAYSLISDYYSRGERPRALGFFFLGGPCAAILGFTASGWLMQLYGWRVMFTIVGLPGILLALIARLTLNEPRKLSKPAKKDSGGAARVSAQSIPARRSPHPSFWHALRLLYVIPTYRNLLLALVVSYFFAGNLQWQATYFVREYGLTSGMLGTSFAIVYGVPGLIGAALGGMIASRWAEKKERVQLEVVAILYCLGGLILAMVYLTHDYHVAFGLIGLSTLLFGLLTGPLFAALQAVVPSRLRALSLMIIYFFANLIGTGIGPLFVGMTSDLLHPFLGSQSLRYALSETGPWLFLSGWFVWQASRSVTVDIEAVGDPPEAFTELYESSR